MYVCQYVRQRERAVIPVEFTDVEPIFMFCIHFTHINIF